MLFDNHGRIINYVRLAVTDRCNLRCFYCMPEEGIQFMPKQALMRYEEMLRLLNLLSSMGVNKLRLTGGEPFVRRDFPHFLEKTAAIQGLKTIALTTNGTLTQPWIRHFKEWRIKSVNLSLDSLDAARFRHITRRDDHAAVMRSLYALLEAGIETKINCVVMQGINDADLLPLVEFARKHPVSVRFIEEMPFNGSGRHPENWVWDHRHILAHIQSEYPELRPKTAERHATASLYEAPDFQGDIGIIAAFTRTFCGSCNRIRITPQGLLKTCLYDAGVFNIRDLMREGASDQQLQTALLSALSHRAKDGHEAEASRFSAMPVGESMTTIGG